ncbi:carbohydrate ABC transporter permease [candidate division WOR-3 bacterium]|nr:carbohydrate ABC transporter permease [candidate division WOR-3 bacterium]
MIEEKFKSVIIWIGCVLLVVFCLTPFLYMILISLSSSPDFLTKLGQIEFSFKNYYSVLSSKSLHFIDYLRNSLIISAASAFFCVIIAGLGAYSITRLALPGKMLILFFVLAVSMFPQISLVGYLFKFMSSIGWINTYFALIFPYVAWILPLSLWILVSYFAQIPRDLDKAALIDGCTGWQILRKVIFPVAAPGIFSVSLLSFIFAFNEFMFALMLTIDYHSRTIPVGIALFQGLHGEIPWGNIMAGSAIAVIPVVLLTIIFQSYIIQGLTRGSIKG